MTAKVWLGFSGETETSRYSDGDAQTLRWNGMSDAKYFCSFWQRIAEGKRRD